jgi:hypothetical protein
MSILYVSHAYGGDKKNIERAKRITKGLQKQDLSNCYICPLMAFSHLEYGEIGKGNETELRLDLLTCADRLIIASEIDKQMQTEVKFAKLVKMEVMQLDKNGKLRPFKK